MDRSWIRKSRRFSNEHIQGVNDFMGFVRATKGRDSVILCPCAQCLNHKELDLVGVRDHLLMYGMQSSYDRWIHHGELSDGPQSEQSHEDDGFHERADHEIADGNEDFDDDDDDGLPDIFRDMFEAELTGAGGVPRFGSVLDELHKELQAGSRYTKFSFVVKLLHIKSFYRITNVAFTAMMKLLSLAFPHCSLPASYNEAKNFLSSLGLGYTAIHVCPNNCILFRRQYEKLDQCPVCEASRWKDTNGNKRIPEKVLRHFPIIPRLRRMFSKKELAEDAQWHLRKRRPVNGEMNHPADGEAWKDFDRTFPEFASDPRNLRLGLATDGFNPFSQLSSSHSMWPVFLVPYNLPPWECVEQSNLMMALLIPGPSSPAKDFDVFLEPLIEELIQLWEGVLTFDASSGAQFKLHAAVLWCIHDYPALATLSGRVTKGYYACARCDKNPCSIRIKNKICYIGHHRFLGNDDPLRANAQFRAQPHREKPGQFTTEELLQQLDNVKDVRPGISRSRKRKRVEGQCWKLRSSLFDLPYWTSLKIPHNLDVMHIEKNICEALLATLLNISGKTKDTLNARIDLEELDIMPQLQLQLDGDQYVMPKAPYALSKEKQKKFCEFIQAVKFPDRYAASLARCIAEDGCKLTRLKTHDCHILLQRILPAALRGLVAKPIYEAVADLGLFFRKLCCKRLKLKDLEILRDKIPQILCKLENIFPPAFFDVMVHLAVHLPDDAILRGPVQYGWMYPVERRLCKLKSFVRNRARPEGSIAEAYIANECLTYCSRYFGDDVDTRFNQDRDKETVCTRGVTYDVFKHGAHFIGKPLLKFEEDNYEHMVWYVLNNCPEIEPYIKYVTPLTLLHYSSIHATCVFELYFD
jgi:hypothetical protein